MQESLNSISECHGESRDAPRVWSWVIPLCQGWTGLETSAELSPAEKFLPQTLISQVQPCCCPPPSLPARRDKPGKAKCGPGSALLEWRLEIVRLWFNLFFSSPSQAAELGMASAYYTYIFTNLVRSFSQLFLPECGVILMGADPPDLWDAWAEPRVLGREGERQGCHLC